MGRYVVNGEVVDVREERPTGRDLKVYTGSTPHDWVMANMPSGEVVKVGDVDLLPAGAENYSIVPPFTYG